MNPSVKNVTILGVVFAASAVDVARKSIAANIAKGYNEDKPGQPGHWTWLTAYAEAAKALELKFPDEKAAKECGELFEQVMHGVLPNGSKRWGSVKADAPTVELVLGELIAATQIRLEAIAKTPAPAPVTVAPETAKK